MAAPPPPAASRPSLRREVRSWEAVALSIGIMAPTAAMALNGTVPAGLVGSAVPFVFALATAGVVLVAYAFVRLGRYFAHAGSVYAFAGVTIGPRAGFLAGWALLGTYLCFSAGSIAETGLFGGELLRSSGLWADPDWLAIALPCGLLVWAVAYARVRVATRVLLVVEVVSVTVIAVLTVWILVRVSSGGAPGGASFTLSVLGPSGASAGAIGAAVVFAFLSYAGFEGAAALGEETEDPGRAIPRAITRAVALAGVFYLVCIFAQTLGFGATPAGARAFAASPSPLGELGTRYVGSAMGDLINLGATLSGVASALGTAAGASRILYAMGRDGFASPRLGEVSPRTRSPAVALAVVMTLALTAVVGLRANGTSAVDAFFYPGTIGVLSLIVAYAMTSAGAIWFLFVAARRVPRAEIVFPLGALAFLAYVFYKQVYPVPGFPYGWFPRLVALWLVAGGAVVLLAPALTRRIGARLAGEAALPPVAAG